MRAAQRPFEEIISRLGARREFLEELKDSFMERLAYDLFEWPDFSRDSRVDFRPLPSKADDGGESPKGEQALDRYTPGFAEPITDA